MTELATTAMGPIAPTLSAGAARLLSTMLDKYEAGARFERLDARDILVHLNETTFPVEFSPNGREALEALHADIEAIARAGAARLVRHRLPGGGQRVELRLGPGEIAIAYRVASSYGYEPLRHTLDELKALITQLRGNAVADSATPDWWSKFLARTDDAVSRGNLRSLNIADRTRLKAEWPNIRDALIAVDRIARTIDEGERELSGRLFSNSKRLHEVRWRVARVLRDADPKWEGIETTSPEDVIETYGMRSHQSEMETREGKLLVRRRGIWNVGRRLGDGGQGVVYEAWRDGECQDRFVLKVMKRPQARPDRPAENANQRFAREVATLRKFSDAGLTGIVSVLDADLSPADGLPPWFVMPRYRYTLHGQRRIFRGNVSRTLKLITAIAETLSALHGAGYAHRDVKIKNIFFHDLAGPPILGDFGLIWRREDASSITAVGDTLGPALWRPPEFRSGGLRGDQRSGDIYQLGGMMYELLAGLHFEESEHKDGFTHERPEYALSHRIVDPRVSHVEGLLRSMLARNPELRDSADEVLARTRAIAEWTPEVWSRVTSPALK